MKKKSILKYVDLGIVFLALVALAMIFLPAVSGKGEDAESYNGLKIVFGYTVSNDLGFLGQLTNEVFKFSFMNFLTYLLVIFTAVCAAVAFVKKNKIALLASVVCAVVAGVFFLLTKNFVVLSENMQKIYDAAETTFAAQTKLGAGPIVSAICLFVAAAAGVVKGFLEK